MAKRGIASISSHSISSQGLIKRVLRRKAGIYPVHIKPTATLLPTFGYRNQNQNYVLMLLEILNKTPKKSKPETQNVQKQLPGILSLFVCLMVVCAQ